MYNERFHAIVSKLHDKISKLDKSSSEYVKEISNFYTILDSIEPENLDLFLNNANIKIELDMWRSYSNEIFKLIEEYKVDPEKKKLLVTFNENKVEVDLIDVSDYISNLNIQKGTWEETLTISFFVQPQNYENFQLVNAFLKSSDII